MSKQEEDQLAFVEKHIFANEVQRNQEGLIISVIYHSPLWVSEDAVDRQCDMPNCENNAQVMKRSQTDEYIWLCYEQKEVPLSR